MKLLPRYLLMRVAFLFSEGPHSVKKPLRNQDWYCYVYLFSCYCQSKQNKTSGYKVSAAVTQHICSRYLFLWDLQFIRFSHKLVMQWSHLEISDIIVSVLSFENAIMKHT